MFIIKNFFAALAYVTHLVFTLYIYAVIARAVISWINVNPYNQFVRFLYRITEPPLALIRRFLPPFGGLDLSPIVLIFAIIFLDRFIVPILRYLGSF